MTRIGLLSDIHLSRARPWFHANWELLLRALAATPPPDLFIITGDCALDAPVREDDLAFAREQFDRLSAPWHALPGNHDIGACHPNGGGEMLVNEALLAAWGRHFGADHWVVDVPGWRLIALNSLTPGSGLAAEQAQSAFLDASIADAGARRIAILTHKPLCIHHVQETATSAACWRPETRELILRHSRAGRIDLIISGHLHEARDRIIAGARHLWLPGLAFVIDIAGEWQPAFGGRKRVGCVMAEFGATASFTNVEPPALLNTDIGNWLRGGGIGLYAPLAGEDLPYPTPPTPGEPA
jgi:3',5'-cyclic AMP phosphodiesterase CpdA